ncbi:hypothetical protein DIJ64_05160 [Mycobacterium leprae]|uniref:Uncharacterized protein n=1 Tax=Mycobacterium leprae TaxID=1769 RepID=A0AAD0KQS7_MYCLR|nr:hypothetical protein DIJ64_05160 [Mycobacterium leprae]OAX70896.1 hypothetical protein A3216_09290 [Mycobacterium leprae 7935681]
MVRHCAEVGFGNAGRIALVLRRKNPALHLGCLVDCADYHGINGFPGVMSWYAEPIVFQTVVCYTMLF